MLDTQLYEHCNLQVICVVSGVMKVADTGMALLHSNVSFFQSK
ncbi:MULTISPECIES: hypothetical protein [unclassified Wolbachia]|nr:hypothetical protein [Wolbachia endosymbiont (group A) of Apoderus coryli]